jgi:hypothetical protein
MTGLASPKWSKNFLPILPPCGLPNKVAVALKQVARRFGEVIDISAYANHHTFIHFLQWVVEEWHEHKQLETLEHKGLAMSSECVGFAATSAGSNLT